jgi:small-conductance mechanosensitive channel
MPDASAQLDSLATWLQANWLTALVVVVGAFIAFRLARPIVHRLVLRVVTMSVPDGTDPSLGTAEAAKRAGTIEDLMARLIKATVVVVVVLIVMTMLGLLPVIAGLGLLAAALTLAGQSIILDYLMGALILLEGQYYQGDWIAVGAIEGTVEEVGLRRTIIRDATGTVHSVSNGEIRISSNLTRLYARLLVDMPVVQGTDVDRAATVIDRVGTEMAADPAWSEHLLDPPHFSRVAAVTDVGITLRVTGRVRAEGRWTVPGELRRRLVMAFTAEGIELAQRGRVVMVAEPAAAEAMPTPLPAAPPPATATALAEAPPPVPAVVAAPPGLRPDAADDTPDPGPPTPQA